MHILLLTRSVSGKPSGHFINISLTPHYNPIIQPMFTAILVSVLWLDSFYFSVEFITHTSHLPIEITVPLGPQRLKKSICLSAHSNHQKCLHSHLLSQ